MTDLTEREKQIVAWLRDTWNKWGWIPCFIFVGLGIWAAAINQEREADYHARCDTLKQERRP